MQFRSKHGPIPDSHFDNEVPVKKNPYDCYSKEFIERMEIHMQALKATQQAMLSARSSSDHEG